MELGREGGCGVHWMGSGIVLYNFSTFFDKLICG